MKYLITILTGFLVSSAWAATVQDRYYGHATVHDAHGVIAPWYRGLNGQCDLRVRIAAETLKRYPWTTATNAIAVYPHYVFTGHWQIATNGAITPLKTSEWDNGDLGQRATSVLNGLVDYYRYTGDPAAIAHLTYMADYVLDHCVTARRSPVAWRVHQRADEGHRPIARPTRAGMIQLDIIGSTGEGLLRAYQLAGNPRWLAAAKHWADVLAAKCNLAPGADPWPRYANPDACGVGQEGTRQQANGGRRDDHALPR